MDCAEAGMLIHLYADGELDMVKSLELDDHLKACAPCAQAWRDIREMHQAIKSSGLYFQPSPGLAKRVRKSLPAERDWRWLAVAAAVVIALAAGSFLGARWFAGREGAGSIVAELKTSHVRSLLVEHLVDVRSSDQHTVKPWFTGKIDFAPDVRDLASEGFPLTGGRLDYLAGRAVAVLVYQRAKHVINVYIWPESGTQPGGVTSAQAAFGRDGFSFEHWTAVGMNYWAVSDVNRGDLDRLARLLGKR